MTAVTERKSYAVILSIAVGMLLMLAVILMAGVEPAYASTTVTLNPGDTYDFSVKSNYKQYGAFDVKIESPGVYTLKGTAKNVKLTIDPKSGDEVTVYLDGVHLTASDEAPGNDAKREAVCIGDSGGTVILHSIEKSGEFNEFIGQTEMPAIRKDGTKTKLVFNANSNDNKIIARADQIQPEKSCDRSLTNDFCGFLIVLK